MGAPVDPRKRQFLIRSIQAAGASLLRLPLDADQPYHGPPHYREQAPLDTLMARADAALDDFPAEKEHDRVAAILADWSASRLRSVRLSPEFQGGSPRAVESRPARAGVVAVERLTFSREQSVGPDAFLRDLWSGLSSYSRIETAEFQVTGIALGPPVATRVRYELVGTGPGFHLEHRVGIWSIEWDTAYRVRSWLVEEETRSRSYSPVYRDDTQRSLGSTRSYSEQLLHGVDHWRTVLDGASGIDVYGHNGVSVGDILGEGFDDLYICQPAGLPNRLYRNRGDGTFEDITESSGVGLLDNTACALIADFDNDGRQDLVVVRASGPLLFLNQGGGRFHLKPDAFRFAAEPRGTFTGAATADYDRDGLLDIYFCLYTFYQGTDQYQYPLPYYAAENGPPNFLMRNSGDATFQDVTAAAGLNRNNTRFSFCCGWADYNRDGWPDLYVVNDFGRKNLYRNNGDGTFTDVAGAAGVEDIGAGMSVCWLDYDNDGVQDLYVADMWTAAGERISTQDTFQKDAAPGVRALYRKHAMGNSLLRGGAGRFRDTTSAAEVGMGRWAWSSDAFDFDHDGFSDLYIANGMLSSDSRVDLNSFFWRQVVAKSPEGNKSPADYERGWSAINELIRADGSWSGYERNVFYANNRDGTFSDVSGALGLDFVEDGRAFALADFDRDGRLEILLKNRNGPQVRLLRNVVADLPASISFRLRGVKSNRDAIGASITIGQQTRALQAGSGFLSQHSKDVFFGLGEMSGPVRATVRWPGGLVQELHGLPLNHRIWVEEGAAPTRLEAFRKVVPAAPPAPQPSRGAVENIETWLLVPVLAPDWGGRIAAMRGKPFVLTFSRERVRPGRNLPVLSLADSDDAVAVYNLLYRYLFDRHRDMNGSTSFLIDEQGYIVKVYLGAERDLRPIPRTAAQRLETALPFPGVADTYEYGRNYLSYGFVFFQRGYIDQAEESFRQALRNTPASAEAQYGIGSACLRQNRVSEARTSFEATLKLHAEYPETFANAWNNLGLLAGREGRTDEAIHCFEEALRARPGYFVALENLGNAYRQSKHWDAAQKVLEEAVAAKPDDPEANYSLGMVFAQLDDTTRAHEQLQRALKLRPGYPEALNNLGILYLRTGRRDQAVASFEESIRTAPAFDQAYLNLARVYRMENAPDKAREVLRKLLKQHPDSAQALRALEELP